MGCSESRTLKTTLTERDAELIALRKSIADKERIELAAVLAWKEAHKKAEKELAAQEAELNALKARLAEEERAAQAALLAASRKGQREKEGYVRKAEDERIARDAELEALKKRMAEEERSAQEAKLAACRKNLEEKERIVREAESKAEAERNTRDAQIAALKARMAEEERIAQEAKLAAEKEQNERAIEVAALNKKMVEKESVISLIQNIFDVTPEGLELMDAIDQFRAAIEDDIKGQTKGKFEGESDASQRGKIRSKMLAGGPITTALNYLWKKARGSVAGISPKDFRQLMEIVLVHFNPAMYKSLLHMLGEHYPDEDNMPDELETLSGDWDQNKEPMEPMKCRDLISTVLEEFEAPDRRPSSPTPKNGLISFSSFADYFFEAVVKSDLLAPSWDYACWKANVTVSE